MSENWRIEELSARVAQALAAAEYAGQESARVRDLPDVRTIRYYTTLGLLDRPLEMRGRTAYYGRRHLLQLVAVKRLQAQGKTLVEVQAALTGASDRKLAAVANLPAEVWNAVTRENLPAAPPVEAGAALPIELAAAVPPAQAALPERKFWAQPPEWSAVSTAAPITAHVPMPAVVLSVDTGISLVIQGIAPQQLTEEVIASLQPAVLLLREALTRAGLGPHA